MKKGLIFGLGMSLLLSSFVYQVAVGEEGQGAAPQSSGVISSTPQIYEHPVYGKYLKASDFGVDESGKTDSLAAIQTALAAAHQQKVALHLGGQIYISGPIVLDASNNGVKALFGDGMESKKSDQGGKFTLISFNKKQVGNYYLNSCDGNHLDVREWAGIVVTDQSHTTLADLSVKYTNSEDFYVAGVTYAGKVNGIYVNDSDYILIDKVEVSGVNRAGIYFDSTTAYSMKDPKGAGKTYRARLESGEIDIHNPDLPFGDSNKVINSYLHHNRIAGVMIGFQRHFELDGNLLEANGDPRDGGSGYGAATVAGTYNDTVSYRNNHTKNNIRKGLDAHDGNTILIENNLLEGDYLYGLEVYNRRFTMDRVIIRGNTIIQNPANRVSIDDGRPLVKQRADYCDRSQTQMRSLQIENPPDVKYNYQLYQAIGLASNNDYRDLHSTRPAIFEISGNTIQNFSAYKDPQKPGSPQSYAIISRFKEKDVDFQLTIKDNVIKGSYANKAVIVSKTETAVKTTSGGKVTVHKGKGSGKTLIEGNVVEIDEIGANTPVIWVADEFTDGNLRGELKLINNKIKIHSALPKSSSFFTLGRGNAEKYSIEGNVFELKGNNVQNLGGVLGLAHNHSQPQVFIKNNCVIGDSTSDLPGPTKWVGINLAQLVLSDNNKMLARSDVQLCDIAGSQTPKTEAPKTETPKTETPKSETPKALEKLGVYAPAPATNFVVNVKDAPYVAKGDGKTDDTASIQKAIDAVAAKGGGIVDIPNGTYMVNALVTQGKYGLQLYDNVSIRMSPQTILQAIPNASKWYSIFWINDVKNVNIIGGTLIGERDQHQDTTGERGFGISIFSSQNVVVENVTAKDFWGDGFYIGKSQEGKNQTENVVLYSVIADNNRRQGLSITDGKKIKILDSEFKNTRGTAPQSGIDIEPDELQHVSDVEISGNVFSNNGFYGILVEMAHESDASISNIKIHNNRVMGNRRGIRMSGINGGSVKNNTIEGKEITLELRKSFDTTLDSNNIEVSENTIIGTGISNTHSSNTFSQNIFKSAVYLIGTAEVGKWLTAIVKDGDSLQNSTPSQPVQYRWYADGQVIKEPIHEDYKLTAAEGGKSVFVEVKFIDDAGHLETAVSAPILIKNSSSSSSGGSSASSSVRSSGGAGPIRDYCPQGDFSPSYYDQTCGEQGKLIVDGNQIFSELSESVAKTPVDLGIFNSSILNGRCYTRSLNALQNLTMNGVVNQELQKAFIFLRSYEMTQYDDFEKFAPEGYLTRQAAAKFFVQFAMNVLCRVPDTSRSISYADIDTAAPDLKPYIQLAYQLGLMKGSGGEKQYFYPHAFITKAQVNAVLVRLLLNQYLDEQQTPWYAQYNQVGKSLGIFRYDAGSEPVARGHAGLMLYRAYILSTFTLGAGTMSGYVLEGY